MRIFVSQIYIEPGVTYPFSHQFQVWISEELTKRAHPSRIFCETYSPDFDLIFNMSAKSGIVEPEIRGPTVFKRDKDVEYTIFLPHSGRESSTAVGYARCLRMLFDSIAHVFRLLGMDPTRVLDDSPALIEHVSSNPIMVKKPRS